MTNINDKAFSLAIAIIGVFVLGISVYRMVTLKFAEIEARRQYYEYQLQQQKQSTK